MLDAYIEDITPLKFTEPTISTIACIGKIYKEPTNDKLNLAEISKFYKSTTIPHLVGVENYVSGGFANSITFIISLNDERKDIKSKLSSNGSIQLPGFKSSDEIKQFLNILETILFKMPDELIDKKNLSVQMTSVSMIKYDISLINEGVYLDSIALINFILKCTEMYGSYEGNDSRAAELYISSENMGGGKEFPGIECYPFYSFKINVTSVRTFESINESYNFITDFFNKNIKEIVMFDRLKNLIYILKHNQSRGLQKSTTWLSDRMKTLGASEIAPIFGMGFSSRENLIKTKIEQRVKNERKSFSNESTLHGEKYEPIALQIYMRYINASGKRNHKIILYQPSSITHSQYPFISASPDSIALIVDSDREVDYKKEYTLEDIINDEKNIHNFYTVEIKCPKKYKKYSGKDCIPCVNGYIPGYYWTQIQQQMYVIGATYGEFVNNNFIEITENQYDTDKSNNFKGILLETTDTRRVYYPANVVATKEEAINDLFKQYEGSRDNCRLVFWKLEEFTITEVEYYQKWETAYLPEIIKCQEEIDEGVENYEDPYI